ncbi:MAG: DUF4743 domain-containing protein [Planctomycetes bacterium]|nr:DUF4743 domain-containing protein [Planctomycetota bacterium]
MTTTSSPSRDAYERRIRICRTADLGSFVPWCAANARAGAVHRDHVRLLREAPGFVDDGTSFVLRGSDFAERSRAMADTVDWLHRRGEIRAPLGEVYPIAAGRDPTPLLVVDRVAVPWFGVRACGVHANGVVGAGANARLWIAERSRTKRTFPGHLDNVVAGGRPHGLSARETLVKECAEEASIPPALAARARFVGSVDYVQQDGRALKVDSLACFDLELPPAFVPAPADDEVESFRCWSFDEVATSLAGDALWKPNCALVALHFLLRRGALDRQLAAADRWRLWQLLHGELP